MRFDVLTIFPEFFEGPIRTGVFGRALQAGKVEVRVHNLRDWTTDKHHCTDDAPYGGGGGMVMLAEPLLRAIRDVRDSDSGTVHALPDSGTVHALPDSGTVHALPDSGTVHALPDSGTVHALRLGQSPNPRPPVIYLSPQGEVLTHALVRELAALPAIVLLCGSYEGVDERAVELEIDRELSIGDYVLTGGEPAALVLMNAVARHIEGVLGNPDSAPNDSFANGLLDCPHYTRPEAVEGRPVPPVLLSGHHAKIVRWRREQALERTARRRPDLLLRAPLTREDIKYLKAQGLWPEKYGL